MILINLQLGQIDDNMSIHSLSELEKYIGMRKGEILSQHTRVITQLSKGVYQGYWQTFVYLAGERKVIRGKTKKEVEDKLIDFYTTYRGHTIEECYKGWINYVKVNKRPSTIHTYEKVQKRHFESIKYLTIEGLSAFQIKMFVKREVSEKELTAKAYASMKTNFFGIYHYAKDAFGIKPVDIDAIFADLSRELRGSFRKTNKSRKRDCELIFLEDEVKKITEYCMESSTLVDLGIWLLFETGLRVGELAALEKQDITLDNTSIFVCRTEERISSGAEYIVSDATKTDAGTREVLLTLIASDIMKKILSKSYKGSDYVFADAEIDRYTAKKFRDRLYRICEILRIKKRGPHAIRRTYASRLAQAGVSELLITKQMGHTDFNVTRTFYIYNNKTRNELISELENAD